MSYFLNLSKLTLEDIEEIKHLSSALSIDFNQAMWKWMEKNQDKIEVLGEMKDGNIIRDEIDENGIREFKGSDALIRIINHVLKEKNNDK